MPAKDLGTKYVCFKCSTKFYDMKKPDPLCPKCGADQRESPALKPAPEGRRGRLASTPKVIEPTEPEEPEATEAEEEEDLDSFDEEPVESDQEEEI
ncbi:TIGR02300 family protein [Stigmatella aurantiaca]|uniref:Conserved uncharacterized protein n=1 Tax=Stigmatella aurantiaca (strain DW4/3-1) TaxID=378806 RepID=Q098P9_STIAD|nr:TIGR02300 family protein [Stigmatella aurantiaca]ADO74142.1 conserved uncharacterized protein [Stigmatella aurantiaca DW4/3-1]EAU68253.1 conserved hypothetical protein [Stigmatella aurantiaca DW4/3-1]